MRKFLLAMFVVTLVISPSLALAQTDFTDKDVPTLSPEEEADLFPPLPVSTNIPNTTSCFDDYRFGSVQADVSPSVLSTVPGVPLTFSGTITNDNPYPIVDGAVYVKIFKKQTSGKDVDLNSHQNGPEVVDQFFAKENISIKAQGSEPILFVWNIPRGTASGDYQVATYFVTAKRFNLSGLSFTDDVTGNKADFSIKSDVLNPPVSFNKNTVTLNQKPHKFAIFPLHFAKDENVIAEAELINPSKTDKTITLTWKLYKWDGLREENKKDEKTETITLKGNETKKVSYTVNKDTGSVAYLIAEAKDGAMKSILDIRFVREGTDEIRLNFPSITSYPLTQGKENSLFSCVHSTNSPIVKDNTLTLTLKTLKGETIHSYTYQGDISGEMMGVKEAFTPKEAIQDFTLTATLKHNNQTIEEVTQTYSCNKLGESCPKEGSAISSVTDNLLGSEEGSLWLKLGLFLLGAIVLFLVIRRIVVKKSTLSLFLGFLLAGSLLFGLGGVERVEADNRNPVVNVQVGGGFLYIWSYGGMTGEELSGHYPLGGLADPNISIQYHTDVTDTLNNTILDGANVPVGSQLKFKFTPYANSDISWFGSGYAADSPYGRWIAGAWAPTSPLGRIYAWGSYRRAGLTDHREKHICDPYDYVFTEIAAGGQARWIGRDIKIYIPLSVNQPTKSFNAGSSNLTDCVTNVISGNVDNVVCKVARAGPVIPSMTFNETYSRFYHRQYDPANVPVPDCYGTNIPMSPNFEELWRGAGLPTGPIYSIPIPAQTINFSFNAVPPGNSPPSAPIITGPSGIPDGVDTGTSGTPSNFTASGSIDPEGDQIHYGFDWDNNGSVDQWMPALGYIVSGSSQTVPYSWLSTIPHTFQVLAQDNQGGKSPWKSHTINILTNQPPAIPDVTGPETGEPSSSYTFSAKSTDPDGDRLRYGFDWNNDGIMDEAQGDQWTSYVEPSFYQIYYTPSQPHSWSTLGLKDFKVFAQDEQSNISLPNSKQIDIACEVGVFETGCKCPAEIKTRTTKSFDLVAGKCKSVVEDIACTAPEKNSCRDFNYREVAP